MQTEHLDVLIVGAGLSGIGAAYHLQERCPGKTYAILEAREAIGGTWDLFRYPGIRSDSDMHTLGYRFRPWTDGEVDRRRRRRSSTTSARPRARAGSTRRSASATGSSRAAWSSEEARWTVEAERADTGETGDDLTCDFLFMCSGYYRYDEGYTPEFPGIERLRRRGRPSPALARGPRLRGQAGRRDRQRRDRGDAGPGDGRGRRPRDDAAALADLRRLAAGRRPDRQRRCAACLPDARRLPDRALEERRPAGLQLPALAQPAAADARSCCARGVVKRAAAPATTSTPTSSRATTPGTSASAWSPTATSSGRSRRRQRRDRHRPDRALHRGRDRARVRRASSRPTSSSPRPASTCSSSAA